MKDPHTTRRSLLATAGEALKGQSLLDYEAWNFAVVDYLRAEEHAGSADVVARRQKLIALALQLQAKKWMYRDRPLLRLAYEQWTSGVVGYLRAGDVPP
jgi:hypothetical protein